MILFIFFLVYPYVRNRKQLYRTVNTFVSHVQRGGGKEAKSSFHSLVLLPTVRFYNKGSYSGNLVIYSFDHNYYYSIVNITICMPDKTHLSSSLGS